MKRREFITLLGGAAVWPVAARAQQPAMPVIGLILAGNPESDSYRLAPFRQGLNETGYVEGQNVSIEYRWAKGRYDSMPDLVTDLLRRQVAVLATPGNPIGTLAAKAATTTVPVVFSTAQDPVKLGLVASLARPGGNLTGVNFLNAELTAKRLGLLRELIPGASRVAVLVNPDNAANAESTLRDVELAARSMRLHIEVIHVSTSAEINAAFATLARERPDALFVGGDVLFLSRRFQLVNLASRHAIPAVYADRVLTEVGGLMSYGSDLADMWRRQVGTYTGRILKGAKPAELPVMQSTKLELVINAETARMLGLTIPPSLVALADEVIE
jgi:putative tryptophan/tyrosine transport system substrate-binding protein